MNPTKLHFWQLTGVFVLLVIVAVGLQWHSYQVQEKNMMTQMMGQSMGNMMRTMHASNVTTAQLLTWRTENGGMGNSRQKESTESMQWMNRFTTNTIFILLPFIMAGTAFLLIVWHNLG
ncbi:MAG TPA: hypothetical protein PKA10_12430 [Selenomonadales bacterium]|nr:hypothetical protein [Selenomonadales bacterium]